MKKNLSSSEITIEYVDFKQKVPILASPSKVTWKGRVATPHGGVRSHRSSDTSVARRPFGFSFIRWLQVEDDVMASPVQKL